MAKKRVDRTFLRLMIALAFLFLVVAFFFNMNQKKFLSPTVECNDLLDNDADGFIDYPADAGCSSSTDNSEFPAGITTCPPLTEPPVPLFSDTVQLYPNDQINKIKRMLSKDDFPVLLADEIFSGNVEAVYEQTIDLGDEAFDNRIIFAKQPTSSFDPQFGIETSTSKRLYTLQIKFNKNIDFTSPDSQGQDIMLFGKKHFVSRQTTADKLVLYQGGKQISLTSDAPTQQICLQGSVSYKGTVELISASDTSATIKVTNEAGASETKEIGEGTSEIVQGLNVVVKNADETNLLLSTTIIVGAEKLTLSDGQAVMKGEENNIIDGTLARFVYSNYPLSVSNLLGVNMTVFAPNSDNDFIYPGKPFVDPVFGTFAINYKGENIPEDDATNREQFRVYPSGDDAMALGLTDYRRYFRQFIWARNNIAGIDLENSAGKKIIVQEMAQVKRGEYVVLGNKDNSHFFRVSEIINKQGISQDKVQFADMFSNEIYDAKIISDGVASLTIKSLTYNIYYSGTTAPYLRINYPDSSVAGSMILYPSIQTSKGAAVAFYKPLTIIMNNWDGKSHKLSEIKIPNGEPSASSGYKNIPVSITSPTSFLVDGQVVDVTHNATVQVTNGGLAFKFVYKSKNQMNVYLLDSHYDVIPDTPINGIPVIANPALIIYEEKGAENEDYNNLVVTLEPGRTAADGIGVQDVIRTWSEDSLWDEIPLASNPLMTKEADRYGSIITLDKKDSDQVSASISYPDNKMYSLVYAESNIPGECSCEATCTDSDNTKRVGDASYLIKGYGTGTMYDGTTRTNEPDECTLQGDKIQLKEWLCSNEGQLQISYYDCPNGCENGACKICADTDVHPEFPSGKNPFEKGTTSDSNTNRIEPDYCVNNNQLTEWFCGIPPEGTSFMYFYCSDLGKVCQDGACVDFVCTDTDGGRNYYVYGENTGYNPNMREIYTSRDMCLFEGPNNANLQEAWCENNIQNIEVYNCPQGCQDGACIGVPPFCTDSDGGIVPNSFGTTTGRAGEFDDSIVVKEDYCINGPEPRVEVPECYSTDETCGLKSFFCDSSATTEKTWVESIDILRCIDGCTAGRCRCKSSDNFDQQSNSLNSPWLNYGSWSVDVANGVAKHPNAKGLAIWDRAPLTADYYVQAQYIDGGVMKFDELGVVARAVLMNGKWNYYAFIWDGYAGGGRLIKKVNGVETFLGHFGYGHNALIKLEVKGNQLIVSADGVEIGRVTDNDLTQKGHAGMISDYIELDGGEHASLDNWAMSACQS